MNNQICKRLLFTIAMVLFLCIMSVPAGHGQTDTKIVGGVRAVLYNSWPAVEEGGCFPLVFVLHNLTDKEQECTINGSGRGKVGFYRSVTLAQFGKKKVTIQLGMYPDMMSPYQSYDIDISSGGETKRMQCRTPTKDTYDRGYSILFICRKKPPYFSSFEAVFKDTSGYSGNRSIAQTEPDLLPAGWISYTGVDFAALDGEIFARVPAERISELFEWVHAGGCLMIYHADKVPENTVKRIFPSFSNSGSRKKTGMGKGSVILIPGFPQDEKGWRAVLSRFFSDKRMSISERMNILKCDIPGVGDIPAKGFLVIIILFSICIGPINIFYLRARKKDIFMLVSVPAVAFVSGLMLYVYSNVSEGIGVKTVAVSTTELDPENNSARTDTAFSVYNAAFTKKDLPLSSSDLLWISGERASSSMKIIHGGRDILYRNFINQRILQHFRVISIIPARERIAVSEEGSSVFILNGLSVPAAYAAVRINGNYMECRDLAEGEKRKLSLRQSPVSIKSLLSFASGSLEKDQEREIVVFQRENLGEAVSEGLFPREGYFVLVTERNPFMKPDIEEYQAVGTFHVIFGRFAGRSGR